MGIIGVIKQMRKKNRNNNHAQLITIMGIILAISIFIISSLAAEIANIDFVVSSGESTSLSAEFKNIRDTFVVALNYNLIDNLYIEQNNDNKDESYLYGSIDNLGTAFNQTKDEYYFLYLQHGIFFDAQLNDSWYSHEEEIQDENSVFYWVKFTLSLNDGNSFITEDIERLIICTPEIS
jgi:hypothetical protein